MSDKPNEPQPPPHTTIGAVTATAHKAIDALPAQFIMLIILNTIFLCGFLWFLDQRDSARERLLAPIVAACLKGGA